jgi:nesprin-1
MFAEKVYENVLRNLLMPMFACRIKKDYQSGLEQLDKWLRRAEALLSTPQLVETEEVRKNLETLMQLHTEVGEMEDLFKTTSKKFQQLVQELTTDEIEEMMLEIKKEKENLVIIRSMIPSKVQLFHHLLTQLEAVDNGEKKVLAWCAEVEKLQASVQSGGDNHRQYIV